MSKRQSTEDIVFVGALADGRTCLGCDRDGEWRLMLILDQEQGKQLAARIDELRDTAFVVSVRPISGRAAEA